MAKVALRGRPARTLGPDFFLPVLATLKDAPKTVPDLPGVNNYFMSKVEARGYVESTLEKIKEGRGRPSKLFSLTRKGREYLRKTAARKGGI